MICAVLGRQEGDELTTNPYIVCGKPTHHLCAVDVSERSNSAINESDSGGVKRFCTKSSSYYTVISSRFHSRKVGTTDDVWNLIQHLEKPYKKRYPWKSSKTVYHGICVLCCENIKARSKAYCYTWEEALRTTKNTTNAHDHIKAKHAEHPLAVLADMKITQKSMTDVINAETGITGLSDLTEKTERVYSPSVARITSPDPPTTTETFTVSNSGCHTGTPTYPILSRDRHDRLLNGQFQLFCDLVGELITSEFEMVCKFKFLNLMHDIWTTCGKYSILSNVVSKRNTIVTFAIWRCRTRRHLQKTVADHIGKEQQDCAIQLLNLCNWYGLGLTDNIQTVTVWNESKKRMRKSSPNSHARSYQNLRNLNNHFKSSKQRYALSKIYEVLSYPDLDPLTDMDVRVAFTCKLIRRSVVNYAAFQAYFLSTSDSLDVRTTLIAKDWMLAAAIEAVTNFIASLALVEAQSENLVASCMVVFRRLADNKLNSCKFETMAIEAPLLRCQRRKSSMSDKEFSDTEKTLTKESIACILLDPRTKSSVKRIAAVGNIPRKGEKTIYKSGLDYLREEHRKMFSKMTKDGKVPLIQPSSQNSLLSHHGYHLQLLQDRTMNMSYHLKLQLGQERL
ncbi:Hypothetical protein PHPALM_460 [Phytophthora palmivora]|uniref:Uncharacterized protein n=1 Tax=Phytophthora palmivora TaxID=4796 RepID=A0A2P4YUT1_9STRA|nr:Hypothetical protein PHPALM_460 [Phytophthora palmivora]